MAKKQSTSAKTTSKKVSTRVETPEKAETKKSPSLSCSCKGFDKSFSTTRVFEHGKGSRVSISNAAKGSNCTCNDGKAYDDISIASTSGSPAEHVIEPFHELPRLPSFGTLRREMERLFSTFDDF